MDIIAVTNRTLCQSNQDFLERIRILADTLQAGDRILLREKDLDAPSYRDLAKTCSSLCQNRPVQLILHSHWSIAEELGLSHVHLPLPLLLQHQPSKLSYSTSVHNPEEAKLAQQLGAEFLIAGHVFPTDCKKGLAPRGLSFLESVCRSVPLPVYGIGGITAHRVRDVLDTGAKGICIMSHWMTCSHLSQSIEAFQQIAKGI